MDRRCQRASRAARGSRRSHFFAALRDHKCGLHAEVQAFPKCERRLALAQRGVPRDEEVAVDFIVLVELDAAHVENILFLELADGEPFNLRELPAVREAQDCLPFLGLCFVDRVATAQRKVGLISYAMYSWVRGEARTGCKTPRGT